MILHVHVQLHLVLLHVATGTEGQLITSKIAIPANMQKFRMLLKGLEIPMQKAMMSVSDVIVTEMADVRYVSDIRSRCDSLMSVCRQPAMRMNMSSTPRPKTDMQYLYMYIIHVCLRSNQILTCLVSLWIRYPHPSEDCKQQQSDVQNHVHVHVCTYMYMQCTKLHCTCTAENIR